MCRHDCILLWEVVMGQVTLGSLFDGIGGFPYAASFYGVRTLWASEVMEDCISATRRHFPEVCHTGDITKLHGGRLPPVDIITFGSPCQGLSLAGKRRGFLDERSGLFLEAVRVIYEMKEATDGKYPRFALWENVPGALSSAGGRDFKAVLEALTESEVPMPRSGKWANAGMVRSGGADLAWCVYDAQYFGTAQRRRRVFLVTDFGGRCAGEILFNPKSLRGYFEAGGTPWQGVSAFGGEDAEKAGGGHDADTGELTGWDIAEGDVYCIAGNTIGRKPENGGHGICCQQELSYTLTTVDRHVVIAPVRAEGRGRIYAARRLTPLECERLQGFPDDWTRYRHDGRQIGDTRRYEMLGNSIAVPCAAYIMQGMCHVLKKDKE